ncbi:AMP-binding protein [Grimontia sp. NTOU-MAR1]|uniref:AMP-binding protein n=1 Tax=Grimontia sp. NTOU-MAR1 TaxID=3111011 RepID=UPI002DBFAE94|nr:AMP-binding protein [Grimontia sp. NTOU-MAR1]WRV97177.1 AMP-binding protein [Grimontia sp. NTOU-MAR1]
MNRFTPLSCLCLSERNTDLPVALGDGGRKNWGTFTDDVALLASVLKASPAQKWALAFEDSYLFATAFFACAHAGKSLVLPGNLQAGSLTELSIYFDAILHDSRVAAPAGIASVSLPLSGSHSTSNLRLEAFDNLTLTLYTSGSSGVPKAIEKSLFQIQEELNQLETQWGAQLEGTHIQSTVSHQHIYGLLFRLLWPLSAGRQFQRHDLVYPEQVIAKADEQTVLISSPALLKRMIEPTSGQYRAIFSSGGPLPISAAQSSLECLGTLPIEVYGSTETGGIGFRQQSTETTLWQLFSGICAQLDDVGCLRLLSPYITPGHWYQTADLCELYDNNTFLLKGRADRVIKIEEKRVSLPEIEQRLCQSDWITDAASLLHQQDERQIIAAAVVLSAEGEKMLAKIGAGKFKLMLRKSLREWLEPIAIPRQWRFVDAIPQNSQGKRQQQAIETLFNRTQ